MIRHPAVIAFGARLHKNLCHRSLRFALNKENVVQKIAASLASLATCLALLSTHAFAQTATQPMGASPRVERGMQMLQTRFAQANVTHDGKLTRDQASTGMPMVAKHFDEIDTQKNGYVTLPQIEAFMRSHAAQR
jgi:hypothetical protein